MTAPDRFAEPATFPSGVRWEPSDYRPLDQSPYLDYLRREGAPKQ